MGTQCLGYSWATLSPGIINTETWSSRLGVGRWTNNSTPQKGYVTKPHKRSQGPNWAVEPYDDDEYLICPMRSTFPAQGLKTRPRKRKLTDYKMSHRA
jgi:hypothetical protein